MRVRMMLPRVAHVTAVVLRPTEGVGRGAHGAVPGAGQLPGAAVAFSKARAVWWYALGGLWVVDGLLQLQPRMFTSLLAQAILQPAAQGQPAWIALPMSLASQLWTRYPVLCNASVVAVQLSIGGLLLLHQRHPTWGRVGLMLSLLWGLFVWYVGEGLGGLFTGTSSYLTGAPGSALLYVVLAAALLVPESAWSDPRLLRGARRAVGAVWLLGALLQVAPLYWSPFGLSGALQGIAMMGQPSAVAALDYTLVTGMAHAPGAWNAAYSVAMAILGGVIIVWRGGMRFYLIVFLALAATWVTFQGSGMLFSGMATDPNTVPLWALLLLPGWFEACDARSTPSSVGLL